MTKLFSILTPPLTPPRRGEGKSAALTPPSPLRGGVRGGGKRGASSLRIIAFAFLALIAVIIGYPSSFAQDSSEDEDRSYFVGYVEDQLSTPNRQIRIGEINGVLSSNATISSITIADREGVWLRITNASIVWSRSSLLLGNLEIETLAADQIDVIRQPLPEEGLPAPEAGEFQIPELPLSVNLAALQVPRVTFGEGLFGLRSEISIGARLRLDGGSLDTAFNVRRLDGPGGNLALAATYANSDRRLNLDFTLDEPANGMVANLLGVEGRPPMALALKGAGPLDALDVDLTLDADSQRVLTGKTLLRRQADGLGFNANLQGPIARLVAPQFRDFFGANTTLTATGSTKDAGGFELTALDLTSEALTLKAAAATSPDGFLSRLNLDARIADANAQKVVLPVAGGETQVDRASFTLSFGENQSENWTGNLEIAGLTTSTFGAENVALNLGGLAQNLSNPGERRITFGIDGAASGIVAERADVAEALGERITLDIDGDWSAGQPLKLANAAINGNGMGVNVAGEIAEQVFNGTIAIDARSIAPFSEMAGRDLAGGLDLDARGSITPIGGGFDLTIDGTGNGLQIGETAADNLLQGQTRLAGRVARGQQGLIADKLRIFNDQVDMTADGRFASGAADFDFDLSLSDLGLISERASGRLVAKGRAEGQNNLINLTFNADVPQGSLSGRNLTEGRLGFQGALQGSDLNGQVTGNAFLDGTRVTLTSNVATAAQTRRLSDLVFEAGATRVTGGVTQDNLGLLDGQLTLRSSDISTAAALALVEASGAVNAQVTLTKDGRQNAELTGDISNLVVEQTRVGRADIQATVQDLFAVPMANGRVTASDISAGGIDVATLTANATQQGTTTNFDAETALTNGTVISTRGALSPEEGGYRLNLAELQLVQGQLAARLTQPTSLAVRGQNVTLDGIVMDVGGGRIEARGEVAEQLDLNVAIRALPLAIANAVKPDLALGGMLDGTTRIGGSRSQPEINFDIKGQSLTAAALTQAGLSQLNVDARGSSTTELLNVDATVTSPEGLRATANGGIPLAGGELGFDLDLQAFPLATLNAVAPGQSLDGLITGRARVTGTLERPAATFDVRGAGVRAAPLAVAGLVPLEVTAEGNFADDVLTLNAARATGPGGFALTANGRVPVRDGEMALDVDLNSFPLSAVNSVAPGQDLGGTITGTARIGGTISAPSASFNLDGAGLRAAPLNDAGLAPIQLSADGRFADNVLNLNSLTANGPQGLTLSARGTVPVAGGGMNISINGEAPLAVANRFLADRGAQASGTLQVQATVSGAMSDPQIRGMFSTQGAQFIDPESNLRLNNIAVMGTLDGDRINFRTVSAALGQGGTVTAGGSVGISDGFPADLTINLNQARYADGNMLVATVNGRITVTGALARDPLIGGQIDVDRAEITVPDSLGGSATMLDVKHYGESKAVRETLRRAKANDGTPTPTARPSVARFNIVVNAPNQIFVRGRGLDAELGGSVTLTGRVTDIQPVGGFKLIRGRLGILGQRIEFEEGEVTLVGDLDPYIDFVARSQGSDITVFINVRGRVSDLDITFSSQPQLPQDEVLARLIFNRGINDLSPLQIAQLAAAAAELAGGSNNSLLGGLRSATGLDDVDIVTDSEGNAAVRAGRYISDNIYLGAEAGAGGSVRGTVNLDITEELKAKGSVGSDGDSSVGVFYEKDY